MLDEAVLDRQVRIPQLLAGDGLHARPSLLARLLLDEVLTEVLAVEGLPLGCGPGG